MPKYDLLLADADGTLLDFDAAEDRAIRMTMAAMEVAAEDHHVARYKAINESLWRAFERREVTQAELRLLRFSRFFEELGVTLLAEKASDYFVEALAQQADVLEGAEAFLKEAASRVPVVVVTNGIPSVQRSRFARSPLGRYIKDYVISGETGFAKPDPRMIERALELSGVFGGRALMLGDEPASDMGAAVAAGIDSCWYNPGGRVNLTGYRPTYEIRGLNEALQWL
ncbi:MAG: YjjG family noncanonical pyrimidine nucleotidase [Firmicutes bacterium]|nr:YjjG family noncanonical pyrimidine nucleotidase [Bacillota bacterium]